jgi:hypothetical protein
MGNPAHTPDVNQPSQVFYDPSKGQYFSYKPSPTPLNPFINLINSMGGNVKSIDGNPYTQERNYYGSSLFPENKQPAVVPNYSDITNLFPALNSSIAQNLQNSLLTPTNTQSSGAGRFLSPSNTQGK